MSTAKNHSDNDGAFHRDRSSLWQWSLVVGLAFLSVGLGAVGFHLAAYHDGERMGWVDAFYNSLRLFHMHFDRPLGALPVALQIARFLSPLLLVITLFKGFVYAAHSHRQAFFHRSQNGHVVICGLGQKGLHLAREYRRKQRWVVVIERDRQNELLPLCDHERIHYIIGDAAEPAVLREARVGQARQVIVVTPDDETNVRIAMQLCKPARRAGPEGLECFVHLENVQLRDSLQRHFEREMRAGCSVRFFDVYDSEARRVLTNLPLDGPGIGRDDKTSVHVIILGFGRMGRSLALRAASMGQFANSKKLRISVLDRKPDEQRGQVLFHYPALEIPADKPKAICDLQFHQANAESMESRRLITGWAAEPDTLMHVFICIDDNTRALAVAFRLQEALADRPDCNLYVRVKKRESLAGIFADNPLDNAAAPPAAKPRIIPFGMVEDSCGEEAFTHRRDERLARVIHERFVEKRVAGSSRTPENDPALRDWDYLSDDLRASNFQQADHIPVKLRAIGCELAEATDARPAVQTFSKDELDLLAPLEHTRWNVERLLSGWRYGTPSNKARRINENITDWDFLDNSVKKYDFEVIEDIPIILARAHPPLKVVRRNTAPVQPA